MGRLDDETLAQIAKSSGRCYPHEGKAMAEELIAFRKAAADAVKAAAAAAASSPSTPPPPGVPLSHPYHP